jgi:hypothetical protein
LGGVGGKAKLTNSSGTTTQKTFEIIIFEDVQNYSNLPHGPVPSREVLKDQRID